MPYSPFGLDPYQPISPHPMPPLLSCPLGWVGYSKMSLFPNVFQGILGLDSTLITHWASAFLLKSPQNNRTPPFLTPPSTMIHNVLEQFWDTFIDVVSYKFPSLNKYSLPSSIAIVAENSPFPYWDWEKNPSQALLRKHSLRHVHNLKFFQRELVLAI